MVINATWGLGEAIVGGLVSPDTIIVDKVTGKIKKMDVAEKTVITVTTENGTEEQPLNDARRKARVLKDSQVTQLVDIARKIENFYGKPQDIEWCRMNGNIYIVQARPVTSLPEPPLKWILPNPKAVLAREKFAAIIQKWQTLELSALTPSELLTGVSEIFGATAEYYNMAQPGTIPTSMISEMVFAKFYDLFVKRKSDPDASIFVFSSENQAMRSEKALFDLAIWAKAQPELVDYLTRAPADVICNALQTTHQSDPAAQEFSTRFASYLREFGHAVYDLDFAKSVPADDPALPYPLRF
jgi:hypothetical protein